MNSVLAVANWAVWMAALYVTVGVLIAAWFAVRGAGRLDPAARGGTVGFRIAILPGAIALWPILLRRSARR